MTYRIADVLKLLLIWTFITLRVSGGTTSTPTTPVFTCCPPGEFLAIRDIQGSQQAPDGSWSSSLQGQDIDNPDWIREKDLLAWRRSKRVKVKTERTVAGYFRLPWERGHNEGLELVNRKTVRNMDRHQYISSVSCGYEDLNNLPNIDGLRGSALPEPPYYASYEDWQKGMSIESRVLSQDQVLHSKGDRVPQCPGGERELATVVLGEGQSDHRRGHISPQLRINNAGRLAGRGLEVMGLSNLQIGRVVPSGPGVEWPPPLGNETELDVDFCLTWSIDPRTTLSPREPISTTSTTTIGYPDEGWEKDMEERREREGAYIQARGPLPLLQAVYCDPCRAKVFCSLLTRAPWYSLQQYLDSDLLHAGGTKPIFHHQIHPVLVSYFDVNKDGKVSIQEFYDIKVVGLLNIIFDGFDKNGDGSIDMSEACLTSLLRPAFLKSITEELFDFADVDNDNLISIKDLPPLEWPGHPGHRPDPGCLNQKPLSECLIKLKKLEHVCALFGSFERGELQETSGSIMCKRLMGLYLPLVDRNRDAKLRLEEVQGPILRLFQFLVGAPGKSLGIDELVSAFDKLREPPIVSTSLRQLLTPLLETLPRIVLQSFVRSADKNNDNAMDFAELEGFDDFGFVYLKWKNWAYEPAMKMLQSFNLCAGANSCFPADEDNMKMLHRYFSDTDVLFRLFNNLIYHKDFQFPSWNISIY